MKSIKSEADGHHQLGHQLVVHPLIGIKRCSGLIRWQVEKGLDATADKITIMYIARTNTWSLLRLAVCMTLAYNSSSSCNKLLQKLNFLFISAKGEKQR